MVQRGVDYWVAFAVRLEPDMIAPGNPAMSLLDFHKADSAASEGDERGNSPFEIYVGGDGSFDVAIRGMKADADLGTWFTPASAIEDAGYHVPLRARSGFASCSR